MAGSKGRSQSLLNDLSWESRVTPDILEAAKNSNLYFDKVNDSLYVKSLKFAAGYVSNQPCTEEDFQNLLDDADSPNEFIKLHAYHIKLIKYAVHQKSLHVKEESLKAKLKEMGLSPKLCVAICKLTFQSDELPRKPELELPTLKDFKWRVYVTISTSHLSRVLEPCVVMEMTLSDGRTKVFEVSMSKFHELRYNVAYLVKEMEALEKKS